MNPTLGVALGNGGVLYGVNSGCPAYTLTPPAANGRFMGGEFYCASQYYPIGQILSRGIPGFAYGDDQRGRPWVWRHC
jgi:hypothetical protein